MLKKYFLLLSLLAFISCKKSAVNPAPDEPPFTDPEMTYIDLTGKSVAMDQSLSIDFDKNGKFDILFMTERRAYDGNTKSADVFMVYNGLACNLATNMANETTPDLQKGNKISRADLPNHEWYPVLGFTLMQKVSTATQTYWEGSWKDKDHRYLPLELIINGQTHRGWIELFADTNSGKIVFYRAAISKTPQTKIRAGF
ncbi:hypothetical protein ACFQZS_10230 [Mucilaginibacter calamicampi]|uniref:Lipoprotein n=1 Tax=Mucilaginibacter calamicampi TaxID=1302352 RepID=A0ABW2YVN9_9SPHI